MYQDLIKKRSTIKIRGIAYKFLLAMLLMFFGFFNFAFAFPVNEGHGIILNDYFFYIDPIQFDPDPQKEIQYIFYSGEYPDTSGPISESTCSSPVDNPRCCLIYDPYGTCAVMFSPDNLENHQPSYIGFNWLSVKAVNTELEEIEFYYQFYKIAENKWVIGVPECSAEALSLCDNMLSCNNAGGFWNPPFGPCITFETNCGPDIYLQFCETEIECVNHGGYWSGNYCFWGEAPPPTIPAIPDFYTVPISTLAGFLSPLIESVGGFLTAFENIFDIAEATQKGALFGLAVPNAIAYSGLISDFFNGLPIGEGLLIFIVVIVIVSIFRLVIKLIHIIKP